MRIRIDFYESAGYTFESIENFIRINPNTGNKEFTVLGIADIIGDELKQVLIDDYFNGSDFAVNYIGYSLDNEYFELELIPG